MGADEPITFHTFLEGVHPDDRAEAAAAVERALTPGDGRFNATYRVSHRNNKTTRWIEATGKTSFERGRAVRLVGTVQDVTARRAQEQALQDAARQKDDFIAVLAHELRNPLAPIRTAAHILGKKDADVERLRRVIERQVTNMARLLDDLLDISRLSRAKLTLRRERVSLRDILEAAIETARLAIARDHHALELEVTAEVVLHGDATRLTQVFSNLLDNAAKYTDPGGRIRVRATALGELAEVTVSDSGIGVEPEMRARIFELFTQVPSTQRRAQSHGCW